MIQWPKRLVLDSIAARIGLTLLFALAVTQLVSFILFWAMRPLHPPVQSSHWLVERLERAAAAAFAVPQRERPAALARLGEESLILTWQAEAPRAEASEDSRPARLLQFILDSQLGPAVRRVVVLSASFGARTGSPSRRPADDPPSAPAPEMRQSPLPAAMMLDMPIPGAFSVAIEGGDGTWLLAAPHELSFEEVRDLTIGLWLLIAGLTVALLSFWAARRFLVPVRQLAEAAERLGIDANAPLLPESGPREIKAIIAACNGMVSRLRRFINDRTQMMAAMSHDLRTPLTRLRLHAEFVSDPEQRDKMLAAIAAMDQMIESTLEFAAEEAKQEPRRRIDIASLIATICDDMTDLGLAAFYEGPSHLVFSCQATQIRRALTNLMDNAAKYGRSAHVSLVDRLEYLEITVVDDGPGIPPSEQEAVFQPFYRLERSRNRNTGGIGLGLAVARTVVRAHAGEITLANLSPRGLEVKVMLPRAPLTRPAPLIFRLPESTAD